MYDISGAQHFCNGRIVIASPMVVQRPKYSTDFEDMQRFAITTEDNFPTPQTDKNAIDSPMLRYDYEERHFPPLPQIPSVLSLQTCLSTE